MNTETPSFQNHLENLRHLLPYFGKEKMPISIDSLDALLNWLAVQLEILSNNDFGAFLQLLYRIDVKEERVKNIIINDDAPFDKIAQIIFDRELEKQKWRIKFRSKSEGSKFADDEEHEKWD